MPSVKIKVPTNQWQQRGNEFRYTVYSCHEFWIILVKVPNAIDGVPPPHRTTTQFWDAARWKEWRPAQQTLDQSPKHEATRQNHLQQHAFTTAKSTLINWQICFRASRWSLSEAFWKLGCSRILDKLMLLTSVSCVVLKGPLSKLQGPCTSFWHKAYVSTRKSTCTAKKHTVLLGKLFAPVLEIIYG